MVDVKKMFEDEADKQTAQNMARIDALMAIYSPEERAAFSEGATMGAGMFGYLLGQADAAQIVQKVLAALPGAANAPK